MLKRIAGTALAAACVLSLVPTAGAVGTSASAAILMDAESGRVLYEHNAHEPRLIASTTKLMTALVALESGRDLDEVVTTAFVLAMDTKNLCSEDCKGLCAKCGADLNLGPCGCRPDVDPRWAALAQLLDDES